MPRAWHSAWHNACCRSYCCPHTRPSRPPFAILCLPPTCRSWRWPLPQQAVCWWIYPSCSCCRCAAKWLCAPCRPMASQLTPFRLLSPQPWPRPACQPRSPAPHHDQAQRADPPSLQPPQGLETPALLSAAMSPMELESLLGAPQQALSERHQMDPKRSP